MTELTILLIAGLFHLILLFAHGSYIALAHGLAWGTGSRDRTVDVSNLGRRFDRTVSNNVESMAAFLPVMAVSIFLDAGNEIVVFASCIYVASRVLFAALYLFGVPIFRTVVWFIGKFAILAIVGSAGRHLL